MVQMTFDTMTLRERTGKRRVRLPHDRAEVWYYTMTKHDAEIIIRDLGKLPQGGSTCDRLLESGRPITECLMDPQDRELHYWNHNASGITKRIRYDGEIIDEISIHKRGCRGENCKIISARIEGAHLIVETEATEYEIRITDDPKHDIGNFIDEPYNPAFYTEHLLIHALNHGKTPQEIRQYADYHCVNIYMYSPWTRDYSTGELAPNTSFDEIRELAISTGVVPMFRYDVIPYWPNICPVAKSKYCQRRALGLCKVKDRTQCVGCWRFFSRPEIEIDPKDIDRPKAGNKRTPARCAEADA